MTLSPIVLFTYNRPEHTRRTLNALKSSLLAGESVLYIYADGPKDNASTEDLNAIEETRLVIKEQQWCSEVHIIESTSNKGLASSILNGVTEVIEEHGKIIVLEDDIVVHKYFLKYMNAALDYFEKRKDVFHVNGFNNRSDLQFLLKDYYFLHFMSCWGWGTWKDRWMKIEKNHNFYYSKLKEDSRLLSEFNYGNVLNFDSQLKDNINGKIKTWAILWFSSVFFNKGLCITPKFSLVENIGLDGTGVHCASVDQRQEMSYPKNVNFEEYFQKLRFKETFFSRLHLKLFYKYGETIRFQKVKRQVVNKAKSLLGV